MRRFIKIIIACVVSSLLFVSAAVWAVKHNDEISAWLAGGSWHYYTVKNGDSWSSIFNAYHLDTKDKLAVIKLFKNKKIVVKLYPQQQIALMSKGKSLLSLYFRFNNKNFIINKNNNKFSMQIEKQKIEKQIRHTSFVVNNSLYGSALKNNMPKNLIANVIKALESKVDFRHDVRSQDKVFLTYEKTLGSSSNNYKLLDAKFCHKDKCFRAIAYTDKQGNFSYYDQSGRSLQRVFDRSPLKKYRVSSSFSRHRWHPVLHIWRSHLGADLAAAYGSEIHATGDGKIVFSGNRGGYGRAVVIRHGSKYKTVYAHMSKIANKSKVGNFVHKGDVIGFVGQTGVATGPHCHYEFRINGRAVNPLKIKLPNNKKIHYSELKKFNDKMKFLNQWMPA